MTTYEKVSKCIEVHYGLRQWWSLAIKCWWTTLDDDDDDDALTFLKRVIVVSLKILFTQILNYLGAPSYTVDTLWMLYLSGKLRMAHFPWSRGGVFFEWCTFCICTGWMLPVLSSMLCVIFDRSVDSVTGYMGSFLCQCDDNCHSNKMFWRDSWFKYSKLNTFLVFRLFNTCRRRDRCV